MNESHISPEYEEGVEQFLQFASERGQPDEDGKYYCPCINFLNGRRQILDDIREHLLCDEIKRNYTMWIWHGEMTDMQSGSPLRLWQVYQIVTSSKVLGSPSVESTGTLFVLRLMKTQFTSINDKIRR